MTRVEFVGAVSQKLRDLGVRKAIHIPRHVFYISDDSGTKRDFVVKQTDRTESYTQNEIDNILDAICETLKETLARGEKVSIRGIGTFYLKLKKATAVNHPVTGERIEIEQKYVPFLNFAPEFKILGKLYGISLADLIAKQERDPVPYDDEPEDGES